MPLKRSKTTISVPANRNQGSASENSQQPPQPPTPRSKPKRSMTDAGRNLGIQQDLAAPARGLSLRSPQGRVSPEQKSPASSEPCLIILSPLDCCQATNVISHSFDAGERMTEFYDDYIDSYKDQPQSAPIRRNNTIATWARNNANPENPPPPSRSPSTRPPPPSSFSGGGGVRRRGTTVSRQRSQVRRRNTYEEEEEGYGSGDYDEGSNY